MVQDGIGTRWNPVQQGLRICFDHLTTPGNITIYSMVCYYLLTCLDEYTAIYFRHIPGLLLDNRYPSRSKSSWPVFSQWQKRKYIIGYVVSVHRASNFGEVEKIHLPPITRRGFDIRTYNEAFYKASSCLPNHFLYAFQLLPMRQREACVVQGLGSTTFQLCRSARHGTTASEMADIPIRHSSGMLLIEYVKSVC